MDCANLLFLCADSRFAKPRIFLLEKVLIVAMRSCHCGMLIRGLQNLEASFIKGFNCCGAKLRLRWAGSRFCKPRISAQKQQIRTIQLNPFLPCGGVPAGTAHSVCFFAALGGCFFPPCGGPMLLPQHFSPPCGGSFLAKKQRNDRRIVPLLLLYSPWRRYA